MYVSRISPFGCPLHHAGLLRRRSLCPVPCSPQKRSCIDVELEKKTPPEFLYHGTGEKFVSSIDKEGLLSKSRLYVHLSKDTDTAVKVGSRHGKPVVYRVAAGKMANDGYEFFLSVNGVWLTKAVPAEYLSKL